VKQHDDSHHFGQTQGRRSVTLAGLQQLFSPEWFKEQAKVVDVAENG